MNIKGEVFMSFSRLFFYCCFFSMVSCSGFFKQADPRSDVSGSSAAESGDGTYDGFKDQDDGSYDSLNEAAVISVKYDSGSLITEEKRIIEEVTLDDLKTLSGNSIYDLLEVSYTQVTPKCTHPNLTIDLVLSPEEKFYELSIGQATLRSYVSVKNLAIKAGQALNDFTITGVECDFYLEDAEGDVGLFQSTHSLRITGLSSFVSIIAQEEPDTPVGTPTE